MSIAVVKTFMSHGLDGVEVSIEADSSAAMPGIEIIGLADTSVKEAKDRIRSTFRHAGISLPPRKIILNLSPSFLRKTGTGYDFALAVATYLLFFSFHPDRREEIADALFFGELGLDGSLKPVRGLLPCVLSAIGQGYRTFFVPQANVDEIKGLSNITIYPFTHFLQFKEFIGVSEHEDFTITGSTGYIDDISFTNKVYKPLHTLHGHVFPKRALSIAAAGFHHILLCGPPGTGKSTMASLLPGLLPPLSYEEILEVSQIYSVCGQLSTQQPLITHRPWRVIHPTTTKIALIGGGRYVLPGEISLAHRGVLFIDEMPECKRDMLESLRQPLEDREVTISRLHQSVTYPSHFLCIAAMNPCPCGFYQDPDKPCRCSLHEIKKYQQKISGPLRERFDLLVDVPREQVDGFFDDTENKARRNDDLVYDRILQAYDMQRQRFSSTGYRTNADIPAHAVKQYICLDNEVESRLKDVVKKLQLSVRVMMKILKVSRTIADLDGADRLARHHIMEALQFRAHHYFVDS